MGALSVSAPLRLWLSRGEEPPIRLRTLSLLRDHELDIPRCVSLMAEEEVSAEFERPTEESHGQRWDRA